MNYTKFKKNCVYLFYCCIVNALSEFLSELLFSIYVAIAGCTSICNSETIKIIQFHLNQSIIHQMQIFSLYFYFHFVQQA